MNCVKENTYACDKGLDCTLTADNKESKKTYCDDLMWERAEGRSRKRRSVCFFVCV